ncbi:DUF484 family protein [Vibrio algivorus]|uniref:DUF484 family protein n=1 Tax=Vibrio algivorus TaxID=1667024 RepID=A0A557P929_9VIBR|nr:DUF484 family protein [Vibrio algivorus]TVO37138.1 DUF484 family protein [Vibrio algivorus]
MQADHLTAETVAEYLKDNPDFFLHRPELVDRLAISHQQQGAVSLVEVQMRRQRQRIEELEEDITQMMSLAAKNDRTFHQLMDLQKSLLACQSIEALDQEIMQYSRKIGLKSHLLLLDHVNSNWNLSHDTYQRFSTNHLNGKDAYLGRLNRQDRYALFGGDRFANNEMSELGSYVVLPLAAHSKKLGLLAFSSQEGGHFQPEMDTLFLRHLTELVTFMVQLLDEQMESNQPETLSCANES